MESGVARAWIGAVRRLGGAVEAAEESAVELNRRYAEPHRRYHTLAHIDDVLHGCAFLGAELGVAAGEQAVADLAACAHDVIYEPAPGSDERSSAGWAGAQLTSCGLPPQAIAHVEQIVLATAAHECDPADIPACIVLDADLAILAAAPDRYADYVVGVRAEYGAVPDEQWRLGRAAVLQQLINRPALYLTAPARREWDVAAHRNLTAELAALRR